VVTHRTYLSTVLTRHIVLDGESNP
jgi:hypothetical protein